MEEASIELIKTYNLSLGRIRCWPIGETHSSINLIIKIIIKIRP